MIRCVRYRLPQHLAASECPLQPNDVAARRCPSPCRFARPGGAGGNTVKLLGHANETRLRRGRPA